MKIALGAKRRLEFIDGSVVEPTEGNDGFEQWQKFDYMVTSWILHAITKDLVDTSIYTICAKELWDEISKKYEERNVL